MRTYLLTNTRFYTFNPEQPIADALIVKDGKILAVGHRDRFPAELTDNVEIEDLGGAFVMPSFSDSHIHLLEYGLSLQRVDCETNTRAECIARVKTNVQKAKSGAWILGHGWNHNIWSESMGSKDDLDDFSRKNPVYLTHKSLHSAWANSAALKAADISSNTTNPQDGLIERGENGLPTGILYESAMRLVEQAIPKPTDEDRVIVLERAQKNLLSLGITSVHDFDTWECYQSLRKMELNDQLKLKVVKSIPYPMLDQAIAGGLKSGEGSAILHIGWLKLFSDGALGSQTAAMLEPYEHSESTGMLFLTSDEVVQIGIKSMQAGISLAIHAIGDRANREVINGYAQLYKSGLFERCALKPRIEHVQLITLEDIKRMADFGIIASMQPIHAVSDRDMADKHWGARCENAYAWKSVLSAGGELILGSDAPVESPNPFWGIFAAVSRSSLGNETPRKSWIPRQRLTLTEALTACISTPHCTAGMGHRAGILHEGYNADLVVLPEDIFNQPFEMLPNLQPTATMSRGEWVFRKG